MLGDIIDYVQCWTPLAQRLEVARLDVQRERGAAGTEHAWAVRRDGLYAIVWVLDGCIQGPNGMRWAKDPRDPMLDHKAILKVVRWGTRAEAVAEVAPDIR